MSKENKDIFKVIKTDSQNTKMNTLTPQVSSHNCSNLLDLNSMQNKSNYNFNTYLNSCQVSDIKILPNLCTNTYENGKADKDLFEKDMSYSSNNSVDKANKSLNSGSDLTNQVPNEPKFHSYKWKLEEDLLLNKLCWSTENLSSNYDPSNCNFDKYAHFKHINWKNIKKYFPEKSIRQLIVRYKVLCKNLKRGNWTVDEDEKISRLVNELGHNWANISKYMPSRSGKQIRDRYLNYLDPLLKKEKFSDEEDNLVMFLFFHLGPSWTEMSVYFPGRTGDLLKNRYYSCLKRKKYPEFIILLKEKKIKLYIPLSCINKNDTLKSIIKKDKSILSMIETTVDESSFNDVNSNLNLFDHNKRFHDCNYNSNNNDNEKCIRDLSREDISDNNNDKCKKSLTSSADLSNNINYQNNEQFLNNKRFIVFKKEQKNTPPELDSDINLKVKIDNSYENNSNRNCSLKDSLTLQHKQSFLQSSQDGKNQYLEEILPSYNQKNSTYEKVQESKLLSQINSLSSLNEWLIKYLLKFSSWNMKLKADNKEKAKLFYMDTQETKRINEEMQNLLLISDNIYEEHYKYLSLLNTNQYFVNNKSFLSNTLKSLTKDFIKENQLNQSVDRKILLDENLSVRNMQTQNKTENKLDNTDCIYEFAKNILSIKDENQLDKLLLQSLFKEYKK